MAAAAGKKTTTSLSLSMEAFGLEVERSKWPHWHTFIFSDETRIDMRLVCPRDVKKDAGQHSMSMKS